jgi:hypothetical protein
MQHLKEGYPTDHPPTCECQGRGWFASYMGEDYWYCKHKHTLRSANEALETERNMAPRLTRDGHNGAM